METEIFSAALREAEIPHRTHWADKGTLEIFVGLGWEDDAISTLEKTTTVFFPGKEDPNGQRSQKSEPEQERDETEDEVAETSFLDSYALPSPSETRVKKVWPAVALACLPGFGLGHLFAGSFQVFFYLLFCSLLGVLFYLFNHSLWSFLFNLFAWAVDLVFSCLLVKENNRKAFRAIQRLEDAEREFYQGRRS
jgi:hypothetical protein